MGSFEEFLSGDLSIHLSINVILCQKRNKRWTLNWSFVRLKFCAFGSLNKANGHIKFTGDFEVMKGLMIMMTHSVFPTYKIFLGGTGGFVVEILRES